MENLNLAGITQNIIESSFMIFSRKTLSGMINIKSDRVLSNMIKKLVGQNILIKLEKNKYIRSKNELKSFNIANLIYTPSYVSFDAALNYHGILSQFPYEVSSATTRKSLSKNIEGVLYSYSHLKSDLFFGYIKKEDFLIAEPEKALLDQIYLSLKGFKSLNLDEYDFSSINKRKLKDYFSKFPRTKQTLGMSDIIGKVLLAC